MPGWEIDKDRRVIAYLDVTENKTGTRNVEPRWEKDTELTEVLLIQCDFWLVETSNYFTLHGNADQTLIFGFLLLLQSINILPLHNLFISKDLMQLVFSLDQPENPDPVTISC